MSAPARYGPSLLWQGKTLRIVLRQAAEDRVLVIERSCDIDALGQPIWLPAGVLQAAELLCLLETITTDQLNLVRRQPAEPPRGKACVICEHERHYHFGPGRQCHWVADVEECSCDAYRPEPAVAGGAP